MRAVALGLAFCGMLLAQNTTVVSGNWSTYGIVLTPYDGTPAFTALAGSAAALPKTGLDISSIYPYSFILTNNSDHTIFVYSARWLMTNAAGHTTSDNRTFGSVGTSQGESAIAPGEVRLVAPLPGLNSSAAGSGAPAFIQAAMSHTLRKFATQSAITITLESVILDSGLALGPDSNNSVAQVRSRTDAQQEILTGVLNAFSAGGQLAIVSYLQDVVAATQTGSFLNASRQNSPDLAYAAFLPLQRARLARQYLGIAQAGPDILIKIAQKYFTQQRPTIRLFVP